MEKKLVFENENIRKLNNLMTEYYDPETETTQVKLSLILDSNNADLMNFLLDFGSAGKLEKRLADMLEEYTKGYCEYRKEKAGGRYTKECDNFRK